jgi:hypothetical protein
MELFSTDMFSMDLAGNSLGDAARGDEPWELILYNTFIILRRLQS